MDAPLLDLSRASLDVSTKILQKMSLNDRFTCALVCKAWAKAATAATHSIILRHTVQDLSCLQRWLDKHGKRVEVLQLHECERAVLTALPCAQLQDLLLHGVWGHPMNISGRVWCDIAAATKLTSLSLCEILTPFQYADVVSALRALPDLQHLTLRILYGTEVALVDSSLLQQMTRLTHLELESVVSAALQHLSSLTMLRHLSIAGPTYDADWAMVTTMTDADDYVVSDDDWVAAGCPGLQELKALTALHLINNVDDIPASITQLTALQQLRVRTATPSATAGLQVLTALTQLEVGRLRCLADQSLQLQLTGLQHLWLCSYGWHDPMPMSFIASCKQLRALSLANFSLMGPGSLAASTMLQHLQLENCAITAADEAAGPVSWQQILPGPMPHLTSLQLHPWEPHLQQSDLERVACCSSLQVLKLPNLQDIFVPLLMRLPALSSFYLGGVTDAHCGALAQLTGLKELRATSFANLTTTGCRQLTVLEQLTSLGFCWGCSLGGRSPMLYEQMSDKLPDCKCGIANKAPAGCPSDLSSRLLRACDTEDARRYNLLQQC